MKNITGQQMEYYLIYSEDTQGNFAVIDSNFTTLMEGFLSIVGQFLTPCTLTLRRILITDHYKRVTNCRSL
jgi:hypothetical protein